MKRMPFKQELRVSNLKRYKGKMPPVELVLKCIKSSGLSRLSFEITYGIVEKTIQRYQKGLRGMPVYYWHIFYEFDNLEKFYANFRVRKKREKKEPVKPIPTIAETNKSLIDAYRAKFNK